MGPSAPVVTGVDASWLAWVERWTATWPLTPDVRSGIRSVLLKVGRWLLSEYPDVREPAQWTRELCAASIALVERLHSGDYAQRRAPLRDRIGRPVSAATKASYIIAVRRFFHDCQEWEWIPQHFDPSRALAIPRSIRTLTGPNPRVIVDEIWAKLLWAGLNLNVSDLPANAAGQFYPLELVRALAVVWLFGGLRSDEIMRLRLGCIRWQEATSAAADTDAQGWHDNICLLDVPIHKTGTAFTKPVDPLVGRAIAAWEAVRPPQPALLDRRSGEQVQFLFCYRARQVGREYINVGVIPALCRKAGVPQEDVRGRITSHRARATIASQLYNAKEPMTLFELQAWLGHRSPETTQYYARITPTTLAKAYRDAEYFVRNMRTVEVLIDRDVVETGTAAAGAPWQYYDLGHGYCTYSFFEQCPHRMACARCSFYLPKGSTTSQLLEAKASLQRMRACIPLTEEQRAAVEDDAGALDRLLQRLEDVPTPAGPTPRQLATALIAEAAITIGCPQAPSGERREERR
jgi:integrase